MTISDGEIRTFVGRVGDAAPPAPEFEQLFGYRPSKDRSPQAWVAAAVAVMLVGGLLAIATVRADRSEAPTASLVADPPALSGLPFPVTPLAIPGDWSYADLSEGALEIGNDGYSSFLFRDPDTGGAMYVRTHQFDEPIGPLPELRDSFVEFGQASQSIGDTVVAMVIAGLDVDRSVRIAESLTVTDVDGDMIPSIDESTGVQLESSRLASTYAAGEGSIGYIVFETPTGLAEITLDSRDPFNEPWNRLGIPTPVGDVTVYRSSDAATRDPIEGQVAASVRVTDPADLDAATQVLASLQATDPAAWDRVADGIAAGLSALDTTHRLAFGDLVVTEHQADGVNAFCATWHEVTRCRSSRSPLWSPPGADTSQPVHASVVVDGLWVTVGRISDSQSIDTPEAVTGNGRAIGEWQPIESGAFFAYAVPGLTDLQVRYDGATISGIAAFQRPVR